jgi:hypothetical protein
MAAGISSVSLAAPDSLEDILGGQVCVEDNTKSQWTRVLLLNLVLRPFPTGVQVFDSPTSKST